MAILDQVESLLRFQPLTSWERKFLCNFPKILSRGKKLSEEQILKFAEIRFKYIEPIKSEERAHKENKKQIEEGSETAYMLSIIPPRRNAELSN